MSYDPKYAKRWRLDQARGIKRYLEAGPVRDHAMALHEAGASWRAIADQAGVSVQAVTRLRDGQVNIRRETAKAILSVTHASIFNRSGAEDFVPKVGAVRRIRALMAIGHRAQDIAASVDADWRMIHNVLNQSGQWISRARHDQIVAAYDELWDTPGTSPHVLARAARAGWAPPLAWDDDSIDKPDATPDLGAVTATTGGKRVHLEDIEFLAEHGLTVQQIAGRLHVTKDAVEQACRRAARHDLMQRLARNYTAQENVA